MNRGTHNSSGVLGCPGAYPEKETPSSVGTQGQASPSPSAPAAPLSSAMLPGSAGSCGPVQTPGWPHAEAPAGWGGGIIALAATTRTWDQAVVRVGAGLWPFGG